MTPPFESDFADALSEIRLPPLRFRLISSEVRQTSQHAEMVLEAYGERLPAVQFAAEYKRQWTPKILASVRAQAEQRAKQSGLLPLIIVPYLTEEQLIDLENQGASGLDLCGNGIVSVPGKYTVMRSGKPNRFKSSALIKNVYRGATSLVARAFFLQPTFHSVYALTDFISARQGIVSYATVSKALHSMEEDLVIHREKGIIELLQADKLLSFLEKNFVPAQKTRKIIGRCSLPLPELRRTLAQHSKPGSIAATGVSSATRYASLAMEEQVALYCLNATALLINIPFEETTRFANLHLTETSDPTVFFDVRPDAQGYPWASPIQTYLEMATGGEPRLKQSSEAIREMLLSLAVSETKL